MAEVYFAYKCTVYKGVAIDYLLTLQIHGDENTTDKNSPRDDASRSVPYLRPRNRHALPVHPSWVPQHQPPPVMFPRSKNALISLPLYGKSKQKNQ